MEIEVKHQPSHLSKKSALTFLANIRRCISEIMIVNQDSKLLEGEVVVDETLWTHEELEGGLSNWSIFDS
jgi:hypothetical protein